jgi:hypothetical protein
MIIIKKIIYNLFALLIRLNLFIIDKKNKSNYVVCPYPSFGDSFVFCIQNYNRILNNGFRIVVYSKFVKKISEFFFEKHKIYNIFFSIPLCIPTYYVGFILKRYLPVKKKFGINFKKNISGKEKKILENILKEKYKYVSSNIKNFKKKKYVLFFVKHFNKNKNDIRVGPQRQTSDLGKIFKVVKFLINNDIKILVLGDKKEKIINILKKNFINKNILYFNEISKDQTMIDQLFVHNYSKFSIGSDSGAFIMSIFLKKKIIFFDSLKTDDKYLCFNNIKFIHKKIIINNKVKKNLSFKLAEKIINSKKKYLIEECSFLEIKKAIIKLIK